MIRLERSERASSWGRTTGTTNLSTTVVPSEVATADMQRIAAVLAAGGGVLLLTWMVSPAASAPTRTDPPRTAIEIDQSSAVVAEVNTQVERLRERLDTVPSFPPPSRDPFNFGRRAEPRPPVVSNPTPPVPAIVEAPPGPVLPHLVAIVASDEDGGVVRSAVISENDDVRFLKPGDTMGNLVVRTIAADVVTLVDRTSGATFTLSLR